MYKIVLDTNVIVSALLMPGSNPALIVSFVLDGRIDFCLSKAIYDEYVGVLVRDKFKALGKKQVKEFLSQLKEKALMLEPQKKVNVIKADPGDNKFLECAQEAKADYLVTGNKKHFPFDKF